jgi:hypothetical protein
MTLATLTVYMLKGVQEAEIDSGSKPASSRIKGHKSSSQNVVHMEIHNTGQSTEISSLNTQSYYFLVTAVRAKREGEIFEI